MTQEKASISDRGLFIFATIGGMAADDVTSVILAFFTEIGLSVREGEVSDSSFLPGIEVENGGLIVDCAKLKYPGDLLHEAAHLAVAPAAIRSTLSGEVKIPGTEPPVLEAAVMLWSYAACLHLDLDPHVVFHDDGYHGKASALLQTFEMGVYLGLNALVDAGMTLSSGAGIGAGVTPFPAMQRWLRE